MNDINDIQYLKPNSHASKDLSKKRVNKVVSGKVKKEKMPLSKRMSEMIFNDSVDNIGDHIIWDVIFPSVKDSIWEILSTTIDSLFGKKHRRSGSTTSYYKYSQPSYRQDRDDHAEPRIRGNAGYNFDQFRFGNRVDAEEALDALALLIEQYQVASVGDLCDLAGIESEYTDLKYGWTSIGTATVERVRGGDYIINLPKPMPIN